MEPSEVVALVADDLLPKWQDERRGLDRIDRWARWDHEDPARPQSAKATPEYKELIARAQAPWGHLIVSSKAQTLYIEGYRRPDANDDVAPWLIWQANGMDGRQVAVNRDAIKFGYAYGTALPGKNPMTGASMPTLRGVSPRDMIAVYDDPAFDEWPVYALQVRPHKGGYRLKLYDAEVAYNLTVDQVGDKPNLGATEVHGIAVPPVVRFAPRLDLEGRCPGEIEPIIPLLGKIDQTSFDRLVVQRFAAWIVRTIAGMDPSASAEANGTSVAEIVAKLKIGDFLMSPDKDTRFGSIEATSMDGFLAAKDSDIRDLASLTQSPVHEVLGQLANLSADALAAARASQTADSDEIKHVMGESYEQWLRLGAHIAGDEEAAADFTAQVRWKDTTIRSLAQAADALGKMASQLGVPLEMLWERIPGFTDFDVERAKSLVLRDDEMSRALVDLAGAASPSSAAVSREQADALGVLIRAGVAPEDAANRVGISGLRFTGAVPVSLRLPESEAATLEEA